MEDGDGRKPHERIVSRVDDWIVNRSKYVVILFFVMTLLMVPGWLGITTEAGTQQFTEKTAAQEASDEIDSRFTEPFKTDVGTTQLIHRSQNVLSKKEVLGMLRLLKRVEEIESLHVTDIKSPARQVAKQIDPDAENLEDQIIAVRNSSSDQVNKAVRQLGDLPSFTNSLSRDYNPSSARASAGISVVDHSLPNTEISSQGGSGDSPLAPLQVQIRRVVNQYPIDVDVFGNGIFSREFNRVISDSLLIVMPVAVTLLLAFLVFAFRDPFDLGLGLVSLLMTIIWTFGFIGWVGIPFSVMLIAVPPLLIATGIDFGIHAINRYREELSPEVTKEGSMSRATNQLLVAFFIVMVTTVIGFGSNLSSALPPIRQFGLVAAVGMLFTFLVFGIFLPAAKIGVDRWRIRQGIREFSTTALGEEGSILGRVLSFLPRQIRRAPLIFLAGILVVSVAGGFYATGIDTSFQREDFLPPEKINPAVKNLPEPMAPDDYEMTGQLNYLENTFEFNPFNDVEVYVEGPLRQDYALESIRQASKNPPESIVSEDRIADGTSILTVIEDYSRESPEFAGLVRRSDVNGNGVPDKNLEEIYDRLFAGSMGDEAKDWMTTDMRRTRISFEIDTDSTAEAVTRDGRQVGDRFRLESIPTGGTIVFQSVSALIFESAVKSLTLALLLTGLMLILTYYVIGGRPTVGLANLVPVLVAVIGVMGSMRFLGVPFNALTATIVSITIGLGVDYSVHVTHRFVDEYDSGMDVDRALDESVRGTGGALTGSMLTDCAGVGALVLAIAPVLGQFGLITAISIFFSYLTSVTVLPPVLLVWERVFGDQETEYSGSSKPIESKDTPG
ncbi:MAG: RND family transporter [Halobacteria archaeon]